MLAIYLIALAVGGAMLTLSLVMGGDHDAVHGHDAVAEHGAAPGHGGGLDVVLGWLPITSLRFWIVFAAFFGLVGTALTFGDLAAGEPIRGAVAGGVGWLAGLMVVATIRRLNRTEVSSAVGERDLVGATAEVLLPIGKDAPGKIRIRMKDRAVDLVASSDDDEVLGAGAEVVVFAVKPDGGVQVTRSDVPSERSE